MVPSHSTQVEMGLRTRFEARGVEPRLEEPPGGGGSEEEPAAAPLEATQRRAGAEANAADDGGCCRPPKPCAVHCFWKAYCVRSLRKTVGGFPFSNMKGCGCEQ